MEPIPHLDVEVAGAVVFTHALLASLMTSAGDTRRIWMEDLTAAGAPGAPSCNDKKHGFNSHYGTLRLTRWPLPVRENQPHCGWYQHPVLVRGEKSQRAQNPPSSSPSLHSFSFLSFFVKAMSEVSEMSCWPGSTKTCGTVVEMKARPAFETGSSEQLQAPSVAVIEDGEQHLCHCFSLSTKP